MRFYLRVGCFWSYFVLKKYEILDWAGFMYFQVLPGHFYFLRGHSLVERTQHDKSAADIMAHSMYIFVLLHS